MNSQVDSIENYDLSKINKLYSDSEFHKISKLYSDIAINESIKSSKPEELYGDNSIAHKFENWFSKKYNQWTPEKIKDLFSDKAEIKNARDDLDIKLKSSKFKNHYVAYLEKDLTLRSTDFHNDLSKYEQDIIHLNYFNRLLRKDDSGTELKKLNSVVNMLFYGKEIPNQLAINKFESLIDTYLHGNYKTKIDNLHAINTALSYLPKKSNALANYGMSLFDEANEKKDLDLAKVISNCLERGSGEIYSNFINSDLKKFYEENKKLVPKKRFFNKTIAKLYKTA